MKHTKLIEPINEAQTYSGWSDEPLESGYYICVDTDYSYQGTGEEVAYIGTEEEAMEAQHSSEGHVEGPFASEEEAREEAINQGYRLLGESKQKRTITLSEAQLRKVITESVRRLIREHDPDDPDYGQYGDMYDAYYAIKQYEKESSIEMYYIPTKNQLVFDEPDEEGEWNDYYYSVVITPKFTERDEYGFEMEDVDYSFDTGNDKEFEMQLEEQYGAKVNKLIDDNFDAIYKRIKQHSDYHIY